ncbi:MAG TPA: carbohydrate porin [Roseiarcus sp.]|nr:carbohydrate porin [Roseiarcus sp.]
MRDSQPARRFARILGSTLVASACIASLGMGTLAQEASSKPDPSASKPDQSSEFVETPVGASAAAPAPASSGALVEQSVGAAPAAAAGSSGAGPLGFLSTASHSSNLLGDMGGLRSALSKYGMTLSVIENSELFGNVSGGLRQGLEYNGLTTATLQMDTQRAFGLNGGLFNASGLQIHGGNLSASNLDTLQTASGIEADRATRLWELWYQQKFGDAFDVKIGQQSLDQEFMVSQNAGYFINTMFGWPMLPSADMPGGGPAYPLSALGVRARAHVTDNVTLLAGVYNGSPAPSNVGDPQKQDPYGLSFPLNGGVLAIAELQFVFPGPGALVQAGQSEPLALTYKIGAWYDSESFADLRIDNAGLSLANPASAGIPASHRGDYAIYAVADQMIWRSPGEADRNVNAFIRPMFTPLQDRNLIAFSLSAGLTMHEPFFGRDDDTAGVGVNFAQVSRSATGFDQDAALYSPGVFSPVRHNETVLEATYQYQVMPWWQIQPDVQYVLNPGAGIANPDNPTQKIKNELALGLRTNIAF